MKVKCKNDFDYNGCQISIKEKTSLQFFNKNSWVKGKEYDARYYDGGVMCPVPAYFVLSENNDEYLFTISEAKPTYELFSEHFELVK